MPKTPPPVLGFNNNVRHQGRIFHIQTEDSGVKRPHVKTHLFGDGGRILKSARTDYAEHVGRADLAQVVRQMMKDQHKAMFVALRKGELNGVIEEAFGPPPAQKAGASAAAPARSSSSPLATPPAEPVAAAPPSSANEGPKTDIAPPPSRSEPLVRVPQAGAGPDHPEMVPPVSRPASRTPAEARRPASSPPAAPPGRDSSPPATTSAPPIAVRAPPGVGRPLERVPSGAATRRPARQEPMPQPAPSSPRRPNSSTPRIGTPAFGTPRVARPASGSPGRASRPPPATGRGSRPPSGVPPRGSRPPTGPPGVGSRPPSDPNAGRYSVVPPPDEAERYAVSRPASIFGDAKPARSIFGDDEMVGEKSLDEVILSYLAEDLEQPPRK